MNGDVLYRRTQIAWPTIVPLVVVLALLIPALMRAELAVAIWIAGAVCFVVLALFGTLTVTVTPRELDAAFGVGFVRKRIAFANLASYCRVRNPWFYGWGVHYVRGGVLYNASGLSAIEFKMPSGQYVRIGTADPETLAAAVRRATGKGEATDHEPTSGRQWTTQHTVGVVVGVLALVFTAASFYFGLQPPSVVVTNEALSVSNGPYHDTIPFGSMRAVTLEDRLPAVRLKTNGFAVGGTLRGNFRLDVWGICRLYINRGSPPFIVIRTDGDRHVIVNFKESARTRVLYDELAAHVDRSRRS